MIILIWYGFNFHHDQTRFDIRFKSQFAFKWFVDYSKPAMFTEQTKLKSIDFKYVYIIWKLNAMKIEFLSILPISTRMK